MENMLQAETLSVIIIWIYAIANRTHTYFFIIVNTRRIEMGSKIHFAKPFFCFLCQHFNVSVCRINSGIDTIAPSKLFVFFYFGGFPSISALFFLFSLLFCLCFSCAGQNSIWNTFSHYIKSICLNVEWVEEEMRACPFWDAKVCICFFLSWFSFFSPFFRLAFLMCYASPLFDIRHGLSLNAIFGYAFNVFSACPFESVCVCVFFLLFFSSLSFFWLTLFRFSLSLQSSTFHIRQFQLRYSSRKIE